MASWSRGESTVARLRLRGAPADHLAARLRIDRILNETSLAPSALPSSAILCIRSLADPLPGSLALHADRPRATGRWTRALASAVAGMAERAARPALGPVQPGVPAIVFLDHAELLACLASDWCDGSLARRWWWRSLFRGADLARVAATAWHRRPEHVPAALEQLSHGIWMLPFIRKLDAGDAWMLLDLVTVAFGLPALRLELASVRTRLAVGARRDGRDSVSPWSRHVPEASAPPLGFDEQCLLGVSLMLQRAPSQARSQTFLQAVRDWGRAATSTGVLSVAVTGAADSRVGVRNIERRVGADASDHFVDGHQEAAAGDAGVSRPDAPSAPRSLPRQPPGNERTPPVRHSGRTFDVARAVGDPAAVSTPRSAPGRAASDARPLEMSIEPHTGMARPMERRVINEPEDAPQPDLVAAAVRFRVSREEPVDSTPSRFRRGKEPEEVSALAAARAAAASPPYPSSRALTIASSFGGLFYLINVGIFLELYADFTAPAKPGIALSIWDFMAAIGERLVGERLHADPVWPMLAGLAGRKDADPPGHDFEPPPEWRMPRAWLDPFPSRTAWRWSRRCGRLAVQHPAGFLVIDVALDAARTPDDQLDRELQSYRATRRVTLRPAPLRARPSSSRFTWWLDHVLAYLQARVTPALRLPDRQTIGRALLEHDARVFLTGSELHVVLSLAALPLAIRLSGLDRNPGWVPAAGRHVAFEFE